MRRLSSILIILTLAALTGGWSEPLPAATAVAASGPNYEINIAAEEGNLFEGVFFWVFALATVASALGVVITGNVVRMALCLFSAFGGVAMLFFLLQAHFLAAVQLIVYVGGILVLIVFGIMLTSSSPWVRFEVKRGEVAASGVICLALFGALWAVLLGADWSGASPASDNISIASLGRTLLTHYLVPFEVAAVLLMVIMVGAAYLARQQKD